MDLTDILSNIFVSKNKLTNNEHKSKSSESKHKSRSSESSESSESTESTECRENSESSKSKSSESSKCRSKSIESVKYRSEVFEQKYNFKKLILKASEFYKRNIFIINSEEDNNLKILSDLLEKLNNMKDIFEIYDKKMTIYTFNEMKKNFKMMLLENPYLNFDLSFKNVLKNITDKDIENKDNLKRHLVIIDFNLISDQDEILDKILVNNNIHLIILFNNYNNDLINLYKIDNNALIINKKDTLKPAQKRFFSKVIKNTIKDNINKDSYIELITNEDLDVKNIIIKDNVLRYN